MPITHYTDPTNEPFHVGDTVRGNQFATVGLRGCDWTVACIRWGDEWVIDLVGREPEGWMAGRFDLVSTQGRDKKPYRATGYILKTEQTPFKPDIEKIAQIYNFRHDAAKLYKFDKRPAAKIRELRELLKIKNDIVYRIENKKYNISLQYNFKTRQSVLQRYRLEIHTRREEMRFIQRDLTQTGFDQSEKIHFTPNGVVGWFYQKLLIQTKRPRNDKRHIGIEIEGGVPIGADYSVFKDFSYKLSIAGDGSIRDLPIGYKAQEFRLLTTWDTYEKDVTQVCKILQNMKMVVNETCGLHVHLDMRHQTSEEITQQFTNLVRSQKYLQGLVAEKRRALHYCKPTRACDPFIMRDRYHAINGAALRKYETIEIRLHHGTVDEIEIVNWITLLLDIIKAKPIKRTPTTLESFMKKLDLKTPLKEYIKVKIANNPPVLIDPENTPLPPSVMAVRPPETVNANVRCHLDHENENCLECGQGYNDAHEGHYCQDEDGNTTEDRGSFPGCVVRTRIIEGTSPGQGNQLVESIPLQPRGGYIYPRYGTGLPGNGLNTGGTSNV